MHLTPAEPHDCHPKNFLRACLLLLLAEEATHGYEINERLRDFGLYHDDPGGLYRALRLLEHDGLVRSTWDTSASGPARRTYAVTDAGLSWLESWAEEMRRAQRHLEAFFERQQLVAARVPD